MQMELLRHTCFHGRAVIQQCPPLAVCSDELFEALPDGRIVEAEIRKQNCCGVNPEGLVRVRATEWAQRARKL